MRLALRISLTALLLLGIFLLLPDEQPPIPTPKRIIFVTIDTLRRDHLSTYGWPRETAPFLRSLADRGVVFERAYSASSHTAPSHASMFTSLYPFEHRVRKNHVSLDPEAFTLDAVLKKKGYRTGALPSVRFLEGTVGFVALSPEDDAPQSEIPRPYWYRSARLQVDRAVHWIEKFGREEPFFLWIHVFDVHKWQGTGQLPPEVLAAVQGDGLQEKTRAHALRFSDAPLRFFKDEERLSKVLDTYDARLAFVDSQFKRLQQYLNTSGLAEETAWIVTADHGEGLGDHNYDVHSEFIYEEQLHVPLIFSAPGMTPRRVSEVVRTVDLLPTIAEWIGVPTSELPSFIRGQSLLPLIEGNASGFKALPAFAERRPRDNSRVRRSWERGPIVAIIDGPDKLIDHAHAPDEVFQLETDPGELKNLGESPQALRDGLEKILKRRHGQEDDSDDGTSGLSEEKIEELKTLGYL